MSISESGTEPFYQRGGRIVAGEVARELGGDMVCGRRRLCQIAQHRARLFLADLPIAPPQDGPFTGFVHRGTKDERAGGDVLRQSRRRDSADRPAGERPGKFGYVVLGVAAAHPEGMQLHDLPGEVLVHAGDTGSVAESRPLRHRALRADRARLVEINQHPRMALHGKQQVLEVAHDMRSDRLVFKAADKRDRGHLVCGNCEMVRPEMNQALGKRRLGCERVGDARIDRGAVHAAVVAPAGCVNRLFCFRIAGPVGLPAASKVRNGDRLAVRQHCDHRWPRLVGFELIAQPALGVLRGHVVRSGTQPKAIECNCGP